MARAQKLIEMGISSAASWHCKRNHLSEESWMIANKKRTFGPIDQSKDRTNAWRAVSCCLPVNLLLRTSEQGENAALENCSSNTVCTSSLHKLQLVNSPPNVVITFLFVVTKLLTGGDLREEGLFWLTVEWSPVHHDRAGIYWQEHDRNNVSHVAICEKAVKTASVRPIFPILVSVGL